MGVEWDVSDVSLFRAATLESADNAVSWADLDVTMWIELGERKRTELTEADEQEREDEVVLSSGSLPAW